MRSQPVLKTAFFSLLLFAFFSCGNGGDKPVSDTVNRKDSMSVLNDLLKKDPANLDLYVRRSKIEMNRKQFEASLADMEHVVMLDSNRSDYLMTAADINFFTGHIARTEQLLKRAVLVDPNNTEVILKLAQLYHYMSKYEQEETLLDDALAKDPRSAKAHFMKGMMYKDMKDTTRAIVNMQKAVENDPDYYNAFMQLGLLMAAKHNPMAEQYYTDAIKIDGKSEEAMYGLAIYYQDAQTWDRAIEVYNSLLQVNPKRFDAHNNLGWIYAEKLHDVNKGIENFNKAIEDDPKDARGYYGLGWCYQEKKDYQTAENNYNKALELDPDYYQPKEKLEELKKVKK